MLRTFVSNISYIDLCFAGDFDSIHALSGSLAWNALDTYFLNFIKPDASYSTFAEDENVVFADLVACADIQHTIVRNFDRKGHLQMGGTKLRVVKMKKTEHAGGSHDGHYEEVLNAGPLRDCTVPIDKIKRLFLGSIPLGATGRNADMFLMFPTLTTEDGTHYLTTDQTHHMNTYLDEAFKTLGAHVLAPDLDVALQPPLGVLPSPTVLPCGLALYQHCVRVVRVGTNLQNRINKRTGKTQLTLPLPIEAVHLVLTFMRWHMARSANNQTEYRDDRFRPWLHVGHLRVYIRCASHNH